jgi:hypothetical protein
MIDIETLAGIGAASGVLREITLTNRNAASPLGVR